MSGLTFVMLAVVAVVSCGPQQPATPATPTRPPGKGKVVSVEIVVDTIDNHEKSCKAGKVQPTTVLVAGKAVRHCVNNTLLDHDVDEARNPAAFKQTVVYLSAGESIRWFSNTAFRVVQVQKHAPSQPRSPAYPFLEPMPTEFLKDVTSSEVLDLSYEVVQQYKISFEIGKEGNRVDPDVVCSM